MVSYNKLRLFRRGMFGSKSLAARFKKRGFNYIFLTMADKGHSVTGSPMHDNLDMILWFIDRYVYQGKHWQLDATLKDQNAPVEKGGSVWGVVE
ncbi:MAG: hypothetical protein LUD02_12190 [Tannerellaceae bacterium]|nr:hypothetical protein [Tannerellaceae bacterium]MCD8264804.1 hypothetical protein [Tannerellaceae bacterium]